MIKTITLKGKNICYNLEYKRVKNINLRIKQDGSVYVSAGKHIPQNVIEDFLISKETFILKALERFRDRVVEERKQYFTEKELKTFILSLCESIYPYFEVKGIKYPQIKFRKMVSQWGNCRSSQGILTFNTNLVYAPPECIEYVVCHEFTHFLQPNHSKFFYVELEKICPSWRDCRKKLMKINIR